MPPVTSKPADRGNIMIVDDNPTNLQLLEDMLRGHNYLVASFPRGRLALTAAEQDPPDLILLDVNMPEMTGYEVCERLKSRERFSDVPVIFLSGMIETEDKVHGFRSGGVDYIAKPFQVEELLVRVENQLKLMRARRAEHELLEKTLSGAVGTLWELVQLTSPALAERSRAVRHIVLRITRQMGLSNPWQYELAARLCLLGCLTLPDEVFEKGYRGEELTSEEERMFEAHPERAAHLLANIPRLEVVAEIVRGQRMAGADAATTDEAGLGAHMLRLAVELDRGICRGLACDSALAALVRTRRFDPKMLEALKDYSPPRAAYETRRLPLRELRAGMVLQRDFFSIDGNMKILQAGTVLTGMWIERLRNFSARGTGGESLVEVKVPTACDGPGDS